MSKKRKKFRQSIGNITRTQRIEEALALLQGQLALSDHAGVIETGRKLLSYFPQPSEERAEILGYIGTAYIKLQQFPQAYDALTEALSIDQDDAYLWFNRGMVDGYTGRLGQAVRDLEQAVALLAADPSDPLVRDAEQALTRSMKDAQKAMKKRGPNFTLDQLIEQESLNLKGLELAKAQKWEEAEQAFRRVIALGDGMPQPWGNLGFCLMMQHRYDEAEAAWKRALAIDKHYKPAQVNLEALPEARRTDNPNSGRRVMLEPFRGSKLNQSILFHR